MKKRIVLAFLAFVLISVFSTPRAEAHHYLYGAEDPGKQTGRSNLTDNIVLVWWWWGLDARWWVDPDAGSQFAVDVNTAVNNLKNEFIEGSQQRLPINETSSESLADIKFFYISQPCNGLDPATNRCNPCASDPACIYPIDWEHRTTPNGLENASYLKKVYIYIHPGINWRIPEGRIGVIAHELGHVYGLHEQYIDIGTPACNADVNSIVNAMVVLDGQVVQCNGLQEPSPLDVRRVKAFWGKWDDGTPENLKRSEPISGAIGVGSWIITTWVDFAWSEQVHQVGWYWSYNSSGPWNIYPPPYDGETVTNDIGVHFYTQARTIRRDVNRPSSVPANSWSMMCGKAWSVPFQQWGIYRCSNAVQLN